LIPAWGNAPGQRRTNLSPAPTARSIGPGEFLWLWFGWHVRRLIGRAFSPGRGPATLAGMGRAVGPLICFGCPFPGALPQAGMDALEWTRAVGAFGIAIPDCDAMQDQRPVEFQMRRRCAVGAFGVTDPIASIAFWMRSRLAAKPRAKGPATSQRGATPHEGIATTRRAPTARPIRGKAPFHPSPGHWPRTHGQTFPQGQRPDSSRRAFMAWPPGRCPRPDPARSGFWPRTAE
jgi:hypothetical protein